MFRKWRLWKGREDRDPGTPANGLQPQRNANTPGRVGLSSMLDLHVRLIRLVHDVLALLINHLRLTVLRVHHGHFAAVADLWRVALLRAN